jgi:bacteriocin biosynthesis cyclodehydratase domain-containing protein
MTNRDIRQEWLDAYIRFRPGVFPAFPRPGEIRIQTGHLGGSVVQFRLANGENWLGPLLGNMDGSRKLKELLTSIPPGRREDALKVAAALVRQGLAEKSPEPFPPPVRPVWEHLLGSRHFQPDWMHRALSETHVLILGAGMLGSRVAAGLAQTGFRYLTILDAETVTPDDRWASPMYLHVPPGTPRAEALAEVLRRIAPEAAVRTASLSIGDGHGLERELAEHDLILVLEDRFASHLLGAVNRLAVRHGKRWTLALLDGWDVYIGPTFFPGESGCLRCMELSGAGEWSDSPPAGSDASGISNTPQATPNLGWPPFADLAAGFLVSDLPHMAGTMPQRIEPGTGLTLGRQLVINLKTYNAFWRAAVRHPECPVCGNADEEQESNEF